MRTRVWGRSVRRAFSLYVCVYIYVYVYILICLCIYVYHTHTHTHTRTHTYYRVYKGGPLDTLSREPKFKQDVKSPSKHSDEDVIYNMSSLMKQNLMRKTGRRTNTKHTLRRGRNMWYGWVNEDAICMYVYTYIHTYIRMIHTYIHTYVRIHTYTHTYIRMYTYIRITYIHTYIHTNIHTYVCIYV